MELSKNEKALVETQTLRDGCSKAEPKKFARRRPPSPGARDGQNLISWRYGHYLYLRTQFGEDRCTQFRVIVVIGLDKQTHTNPHTGPITIHCAAGSGTLPEDIASAPFLLVFRQKRKTHSFRQSYPDIITCTRWSLTFYYKVNLKICNVV